MTRGEAMDTLSSLEEKTNQLENAQEAVKKVLKTVRLWCLGEEEPEKVEIPDK